MRMPAFSVASVSTGYRTTNFLLGYQMNCVLIRPCRISVTARLRSTITCNPPTMPPHLPNHAFVSLSFLFSLPLSFFILFLHMSHYFFLFLSFLSNFFFYILTHLHPRYISPPSDTTTAITITTITTITINLALFRLHVTHNFTLTLSHTTITIYTLTHTIPSHTKKQHSSIGYYILS